EHAGRQDDLRSVPPQQTVLAVERERPEADPHLKKNLIDSSAHLKPPSRLHTIGSATVSRCLSLRPNPWSGLKGNRSARAKLPSSVSWVRDNSSCSGSAPLSA